MQVSHPLLKRVHGVANVYTNKHFVYTGGLHGDGYVDYRPLGQEGHELLLREVVAELLKMTLLGVQVAKYRNIVVVGPETMGMKMVKQITALTETELPYNIDTGLLLKDKKHEGQFVWNMNPARIIDDDSLVLWMDDLLNEGSTFRKTTPMIQQYGADVYAIVTIGDRSGLTATDIGVRRLVSLEQFNLKRFPEDDCSLCHDGVPIVKDLGHGQKFADKYPTYVGGFISVK